MCNFPNDGVGYDAYAELMAKRVAEADDRRDYEAMRGNPPQMSEDEINAQMREEAAEWGISLVDKLSQTEWLG